MSLGATMQSTTLILKGNGSSNLENQEFSIYKAELQTRKVIGKTISKENTKEQT